MGCAAACAQQDGANRLIGAANSAVQATKKPVKPIRNVYVAARERHVRDLTGDAPVAIFAA